MHPSTGFFL
uniref:Uncharacterized protein n=1 Tax=Arundo donax TaxID=35708 RepID=A0A0A9FSW0_ARUDO